MDVSFYCMANALNEICELFYLDLFIEILGFLPYRWITSTVIAFFILYSKGLTEDQLYT